MRISIFSILLLILTAYSPLSIAHDKPLSLQALDESGEYRLIAGKPAERKDYFELVDLVDMMGSTQKILMMDLIQNSSSPLELSAEGLQKASLVHQSLPFSAGRNSFHATGNLKGLVWILISFLTMAVFANIIQWGWSRSLSAELGTRAEAQKQLSIMNKQMHEKAYTDALSGMGNRRAFFEQGEAKLRSAFGTDTSMSALMIDIDHFKSVNDQFGHAVGDKVIQGFAEIVLETVRDEDVQGRIGGEEFAIVASNTSLKQAEVLAERIRLAAEKVELLHEGKVIKTTISIGVTTFDPEQDDLSTMMLRADNALYHAKELGRNRVAINT